MIKSFTKRFENGYMVSVKTSAMHYATGDGSNAEVAIFDSNGDWATSLWKDTGDDVAGWQSPEEVADALIWAAAQ